MIEGQQTGLCENLLQSTEALSEFGPDNVVYDAVGAETWESSIDSLKRRGMVVFFGGAYGPVPTFDTSILANKGSLVLTIAVFSHSFSEQMQNDLAIPWRPSVLEKVDALPRAQHHAVTGDGNA